MAQGVLTQIAFSLDLDNVASIDTGNDIPAVTGDNFEFDIQLSDKDMNSDTDTLSYTPVTATITSGDLTAGLNAQASTTFGGTADVTILAGNCASVQYLCVTVKNGAAALHTDAVITPSSNTRCIDITTFVTCAPGLHRIFFLYLCEM